MSSSKLRTAVVGTGYLGRFHAQKYKTLENSDLIGICDTNLEQGKKVAEELGVPHFLKAEDLIGKVDAVTVAASTISHYPICKMLLENGIHVLVEKPMTVTSQQGAELCDIAKKKNLKLQVGHIERFNSAFIAAKEKLDRPMFIECHRLAPFKPRSLDVDVVLDVMIHDIDVLLAIVNSKVRSVSAVGVPVITPYTDIANVRVEFESGAIANLTASRVSINPIRKFRVFQQDQYLSIDFEKGELSLTTRTGEWKDGNIPLEHNSWSLSKSDAILEETKSFLEAIQNNTPVLVPGEDGVKALKLAESILEDIQRRHI